MRFRHRAVFAAVICVVISPICFAAPAPVTIGEMPAVAGDVALVEGDNTATIFVDSHDAEVVKIAAGLLADDVERVTTHRPKVASDAGTLSPTAIIAGTIGQSPIIDKLIADKKMDAGEITGKWESFEWQVVSDPLPNVKSALVIVGSDRRGTAYGLTQISKQIGVSPLYWWSDVPVTKHASLRAAGERSVVNSPGIKFRGIFINDEDWGLRQWVIKTFDPETKNFGPKTYAKVFELMLRLRLNYIWPAMHPGSAEFSMFPGNAELADQWAIVTGASHCEPMLRNNVYWPKTSGEWRYDTNQKAIDAYWQEAAEKRGPFEAVWTLGIRGIHDSPMLGPKDINKRVEMLNQIIADQRTLIDKYVSTAHGPVAQCLVPYKEVLPLYNAGMKVPDDVTIVWPDDNFGYIRRLATDEEKKRSGGLGVYYHLSYLGPPQSYLWVESNSLGLMWEELHKAYENGSKALWVVNVGDIKPAELAISFYSDLAWNPDQYGPDAQAVFLKQFATENYGPEVGDKVAQLEADYFKTAALRKVEHMNTGYSKEMTDAQRSELHKKYFDLLEEEKQVSALVPADRKDPYFETVGYAVQMLSSVGMLFTGPESEQVSWSKYIDEQTKHFNEEIGNGKWNNVISRVVPGMQWPAAVLGRPPRNIPPIVPPIDVINGVVIDAATFTKSSESQQPIGRWTEVAGLGPSGRALALMPSLQTSNWSPQSTNAPSVQFSFSVEKETSDPIRILVLPTYRLTNEGQMRVGVSIDDQPSTAIDMPGAESGDENSKGRRDGVVRNQIVMEVPAVKLTAGPHTLRISAIDPGVVLDQIVLPAGTSLQK